MAAVPPAIAAALVPLAVEPLPTATELVPLALDPPPAATFVVPLIVPQALVANAGNVRVEAIPKDRLVTTASRSRLWGTRDVCCDFVLLFLLASSETTM